VLEAARLDGTAKSIVWFDQERNAILRMENWNSGQLTATETVDELRGRARASGFPSVFTETLYTRDVNGETRWKNAGSIRRWT